jgi:hypothetical protein
MDTAEAFKAAVQRHDQQITSLGIDIWVGSKPTFTDRLTQTPEHSTPPDRVRGSPDRVSRVTRQGQVLPFAIPEPDS